MVEVHLALVLSGRMIVLVSVVRCYHPDTIIHLIIMWLSTWKRTVSRWNPFRDAAVCDWLGAHSPKFHKQAGRFVQILAIEFEPWEAFRTGAQLCQFLWVRLWAHIMRNMQKWMRNFKKGVVLWQNRLIPGIQSLSDPPCGKRRSGIDKAQDLHVARLIRTFMWFAGSTVGSTAG